MTGRVEHFCLISYMLFPVKKEDLVESEAQLRFIMIFEKSNQPFSTSLGIQPEGISFQVLTP